ncbi:MAG: SpoIID/LytB domain-containing protein, partial [Clostridiales bacterium]|nr:SpoIID/LytB domain-containing protein [Clostridiales bacterium]
MKRWYKKIIVFILMIVLLQYPIGVFASEQQTMLRIGLITEFAEKNQLQISDKKVSIGYSISNIYNEIATLESETGYRFTKASKYYAKSTTKYKTYTSAQTAVSSLVKKYGITAVVGFMAKDDIRVFIGESNSEEQLKKVITKVKGSGISFETLGGDNGYRVKMEGSKQAIVYDGNGVNGYPQIAPIVANNDGDKVLTIGTKQYRGRLEIGSYGKNSVTAVNVIAIDDYLYGVVPEEMPSLWPEEALKAQSVVARTYAVHKGGVGGDSKASNPYQLNDTTASQVYKGYQGEVTTTNQAVDKTSEEYIYYNGQLIDATFFSTSGGATNNSEDVWSGVVPYLRGVSDRYELEPEKQPWILTFTKEDIAR